MEIFFSNYVDLLGSVGPLAVGCWCWLQKHRNLGATTIHIFLKRNPRTVTKNLMDVLDAASHAMLASKYRGWRCHNLNNHANVTMQVEIFADSSKMAYPQQNKISPCFFSLTHHPTSSANLFAQLVPPSSAWKSQWLQPVTMVVHLTTDAPSSKQRCKNAGHVNKSFGDLIGLSILRQTAIFHCQLCQKWSASKTFWAMVSLYTMLPWKSKTKQRMGSLDMNYEMKTPEIFQRSLPTYASGKYRLPEILKA